MHFNSLIYLNTVSHDVGANHNTDWMKTSRHHHQVVDTNPQKLHKMIYWWVVTSFVAASFSVTAYHFI
jgi:hypothetical protein